MRRVTTQLVVITVLVCCTGLLLLLQLLLQLLLLTDSAPMADTAPNPAPNTDSIPDLTPDLHQKTDPAPDPKTDPAPDTDPKTDPAPNPAPKTAPAPTTPDPTPNTQEGEEEGDGEEVESWQPIDVADFFPEVNDDMSEVTWGHRVNSRAKLEQMLADPTVMMLEADIVAGRLEGGEGEATTTPIMAHHPEVTSDLTFTMWLDKVIAANQGGHRKGIKLDFKDLSVVEECLQQLKAKKNKIQFPVWVNADILAGPADTPAKPVPADAFLTLTADLYPQATLSLGWTTHLPPSSTGGGAAEGWGYKRGAVEKMAALLDAHTITQPCTFPVRAALLHTSIDALEWLLETVPDSSLTIWGGEGDPFDPEPIVTLRDLLGAEAVFLDLPAPHMTQYAAAAARSVASRVGAGQGIGGGFMPSAASVYATVGMAVASALAALYLYE